MSERHTLGTRPMCRVANIRSRFPASPEKSVCPEDGKPALAARRKIATVFVLISCLLPVSTHAQSTRPDPKDLYLSHNWFALRDYVATGSASPFYKAAVEAAFHQDAHARMELKHVIATHPGPGMLLEARELLLGMDFRAGRYRDALLQAQLILMNKADAKDVANFLPTLRILAPYKRQTVSATSTSAIKIELMDQNLVLPITVNGKEGNYLLDNAFSLSGMSESEAQRLKLPVHTVSTQIDSMSGAHVSVRIAVVADLIIGHTHLKNVAFYILPNDNPPFNQLASGRRGILGLPVVLALCHFAWDPTANTFRIFSGPTSGEMSRANLAFDGSSIFVHLSFRGTPFDMSLDSGAQNTILYPSFAKLFPDLQTGSTTEKHRVTGVGGSSAIQSFSLPSLEFEVGNHQVTLAPATVLLQENNSTTGWFRGNLGMDLLNQARRVDVDFDSMTLTLQ
jgi:hypothetical protein